MSADFPAAVGQSHFESLDADSCGLERQVFLSSVLRVSVLFEGAAFRSSTHYSFQYLCF